MGHLYYGNSVHPIEMPDRLLAHVKVVVATKLRRSESFTLSWQHPDDAAGARSTIWIQPSIPFRFVFPTAEPETLDPVFLKELANAANSSGGLTIDTGADAPASVETHRPRAVLKAAQAFGARNDAARRLQAQLDELLHLGDLLGVGLGDRPRRAPVDPECLERLTQAFSIDTADIYAPTWDVMGHNERMVGEAVRTWTGDSSDVLITTKGGIARAEGEQVIDNLATLRQEGLIAAIGISNASVEEIEIARDVLGEGVGGLASVQNEFSPRHPGSIDELRYCAQHGVAFLPWSPQRVVLAWELSLGDTVIPGARRAASITDSAAAPQLVLDKDELARCSYAVGIDA